MQVGFSGTHHAGVGLDCLMGAMFAAELFREECSLFLEFRDLSVWERREGRHLGLQTFPPGGQQDAGGQVVSVT